MTEIEKLFEKMKDPDEVRRFERDYNMCFLQEAAEISTEVLSFWLNHTRMFICNYYDEDMSDEEFENYNEDCVYFDHFGTGVEGLSFDCTEEEFEKHKRRIKCIRNKHILYSDLPVLKQMYQKFEKYLDMNAVKQYSTK